MPDNVNTSPLTMGLLRESKLESFKVLNLQQHALMWGPDLRFLQPALPQRTHPRSGMSQRVQTRYSQLSFALRGIAMGCGSNLTP